MDRKNQIIEAADRLIYERGYEATSFADIAVAVKISRGNFYYHFKSKDEILSAVIDKRLKDRQELLQSWQELGEDPIQRIRSFINILIMNRAKIMKFGCPVGTLVTELAKLDHVAKNHANEIFTVFQNWLELQFEELNLHDQAKELASHILARSQGVATLASAFQDTDFIDREVALMYDWLDHIIKEKQE